MQGLSKKWRSKNRMIAGISVLLTSLILFGTFYFIFYFDRLIPYSDSLIKIEKQENGYLSAHYYGDNYFSISATEPMSVIVDGQEKKAVFLHYTKTFATAHSKQFFQNEGSRDEKDFIFSLDDEQEIDVVYYADFDAIKIFNQGNKWEPVLEHAELIWEKWFFQNDEPLSVENQNNKPKTLSTMFPVDKVFLILQLNFFFILLRKKLFSNRHAF